MFVCWAMNGGLTQSTCGMLENKNDYNKKLVIFEQKYQQLLEKQKELSQQSIKHHELSDRNLDIVKQYIQSGYDCGFDEYDIIDTESSGTYFLLKDGDRDHLFLCGFNCTEKHDRYFWLNYDLRKVIFMRYLTTDYWSIDHALALSKEASKDHIVYE